MLWLSAIKISRPYFKVSKYYPVPPIRGFTFITLRDRFYLSKVIWCLSVHLRCSIPASPLQKRNITLKQAVTVHNGHYWCIPFLLPLKKRDLKSNVTLHHIVHNSLSNITLSQFQKASQFHRAHCVVLTVDQTLSTLIQNLNTEGVKTCKLKGFLNEKNSCPGSYSVKSSHPPDNLVILDRAMEIVFKDVFKGSQSQKYSLICLIPND